MASSCACFVATTFFLWTVDDLLNLALLLPICNNYEHIKIGTCETLKIHQSFFCIKNFQEIKLRKMLFTWVEEFLSSFVYKTWTSVAYSIEKTTRVQKYFANFSTLQDFSQKCVIEGTQGHNVYTKVVEESPWSSMFQGTQRTQCMKVIQASLMCNMLKYLGWMM